MKVFVKGTNKPIELTNADFLAQGGEGKIYVKGNKVFKICESLSKMIPEGKFTELSVLSDQHIIKPEEILVDAKDKNIGYTMKFIKDSYTLCQIFAKAFRLRNKIKHDAVDLVQQMQKTIQHIHSHDILLVDGNEFNFLLDDKFKEVYFIDVNSYQTPHYPAMAIMDSIRDRHANNKFSKVTDWFSFAIVSFQMFIGIQSFRRQELVY
jgi:hypothetical protein